MSSAPTVVSLNQIGQIAVTVYDLDRAVKFYHGTLGMKLLFHLPQMAFFDCGGVRLMLAAPEKPEFDHPASVIYYKVADLPATHAELVARDVKFEAAPHLIAKMADQSSHRCLISPPQAKCCSFMPACGPSSIIWNLLTWNR